jgi:hypothetical protein
MSIHRVIIRLVAKLCRGAVRKLMRNNCAAYLLAPAVHPHLSSSRSFAFFLVKKTTHLLPSFVCIYSKEQCQTSRDLLCSRQDDVLPKSSEQRQ